MRRILLIIVALALCATRTSADDPEFYDDFVAIMESQDRREISDLLPHEWENNRSALAARARVLEDAANRVAKRLDVDVTRLLQIPLEQQIRDAGPQDLIKAIMFALAIGHAGQDHATRAGLRLMFSREENPFGFVGGIAYILLAPSNSADVWDAATPILNEGKSNSGVMFLSVYHPVEDESIQKIAGGLRPELVAPIPLLLLADTIESPMAFIPGQRPQLAEDAPRAIPEPILDHIRNNWREIPSFAGWIAIRSEMPRETRDEALRSFLQWRFEFDDLVGSSEESRYAASRFFGLLKDDHARRIIEDAVANGPCSESMARVVMEMMEAEKAVKSFMENPPPRDPVRDEHDG